MYCRCGGSVLAGARVPTVEVGRRFAATETTTTLLTHGTVMLVRDVMETDIVSVTVGSSVRSAVEQMLRARVGSVIVTRDGTPTGILTETDVLKAAYASGSPLSDVAVGAAMSSPLVTVQPGATVRQAIERMTDNDVKKLPVVDGLDLVGVVTMTDVVRHHTDAIQEAQRLDEGRSGWSAEGSRFQLRD